MLRSFFWKRRSDCGRRPIRHRLPELLTQLRLSNGLKHEHLLGPYVLRQRLGSIWAAEKRLSILCWLLFEARSYLIVNLIAKRWLRYVVNTSNSWLPMEVPQAPSVTLGR